VQKPQPDFSILPWSTLSNVLEEGCESGDFGEQSEEYRDYDWERCIEEYATNGLYRVRFVITGGTKSQVAGESMEIPCLKPGKPRARLGGGGHEDNRSESRVEGRMPEPVGRDILTAPEHEPLRLIPGAEDSDAPPAPSRRKRRRRPHHHRGDDALGIFYDPSPSIRRDGHLTRSEGGPHRSGFRPACPHLHACAG
jgi:hypothetical protein